MEKEVSEESFLKCRKKSSGLQIFGKAFVMQMMRTFLYLEYKKFFNSEKKI